MLVGVRTITSSLFVLAAALPGAYGAGLVLPDALRSARSSVPCSGGRLDHTDENPLDRDTIQARLNETQSQPGGGTVCIWTNTTREIEMRGRELTLEITDGSVAFRRADFSPHTPRFDCELRSRFLNVVINTDLAEGMGGMSGSVVEVSGFELRHGRAPHGGFLAFSGPAPKAELRVSDIVFVDGATTADRSDVCGQWWRPRPAECFSGGGAISVDSVPSFAIEGARGTYCSTKDAGGFLAARDVDHVEFAGVYVTGAEAGTLGGAVSLWSSRDKFVGSWSVSNITFSGVNAGESGGGISYYANKDVSGDASWSVSDSTITHASVKISGGGIALWANNGVGGNASWSVSDSTITHASAGYNGAGVSYYAANGGVGGNASWSVSGVGIFNARANGHSGIGGGISYFAHDVGGMAAWSVSRATIFNTSAHSFGGGISFFASNFVVGNSSWSVTGTDISHTKVTGNEATGGGVSFYVRHDVSNNALWSVTGTTISNAVTNKVGGGVSYWAGGNALGNAWWSMSGVTLSHCSALGLGGGVSFFAEKSVGGSSTWSVSRAVISNASAGTVGGGISFFSKRDVSGDASWTVQNSELVQTRAQGNGGGVAFRAKTRLHASSSNHTAWSLVRTSFVAAEAGSNGGGVTLRCQEATDAAFSIETLSCANTSAKATGGCFSFQAQKSLRSQGSIKGLSASSVHALSGAAMSVVVPSHVSGGYEEAIERSLTLRIDDVEVESARAADRGGVLHVEVARPGLHRFRRRDATCQERASYCFTECDVTKFNSTSVLPYAVGTEVLVDSVRAWNATTGSNGQGALVSLSNTVARLSNISAVDLASGFAGGALAVFEASDVMLSGFCGRNVSAQEGALFYHTGSGANVTLDNVSLDSESPCPIPQWLRLAAAAEETGETAKDVNWIRSGSIASASVNAVRLGCPLGAIVRNDSLGDFEQSYPSLPTAKQIISERCMLEKELDYAPQTFQYSSSRTGCQRCPPGKYTLVRQGWMPKASRGTGDGAGISELLQPTVDAHWTTCFECPTGANCSRGGKAVVPHPGRWGTSTTNGGHEKLIATFPVLLFDYACPSNASGCLSAYDACNGHREGMACGRCKSGYGEALNTALCISEGACQGSGLRIAALVLLPLGVVAIVVFYIVMSRGAVSGKRAMQASKDQTRQRGTKQGAVETSGTNKGLMTILVTLFQLDSIVRSESQSGDNALTRASQLQLIPSWGDTSVCLWPGMGTVAKALVPAVLSCTLPVVLAVAFVVHWRLAISDFPLVKRVFAAAIPSRGAYKRAFVSLMVFAYGALASVATRLVTPLEVSSYGTRQALTGDEWAQRWYYWVGVTWLACSTIWAPAFYAWGMAQLRAHTMSVEAFALGVVFPGPLIAGRALRRALGHAPSRSAWACKEARTAFSLLATPYQRGKWWWDAMMMGRRLAFVLPSLVLWRNPVGRAFAYVVLSSSSLVIHVWQLPFQSPMLNKVETAALYILTLICASSLLSAYQRFHGLLLDTPLELIHSATSWLLTAVPVVSISVLALRSRVRSRLREPLSRWVRMRRLGRWSEGKE